jgi:SDR family mycofactocin-dependent oxidoreductase
MITGAARGQGRSHAVRFAQEGADVVALDIPGGRLATVPYPLAAEDDLAETVRLVEATGRRAVACVADVRDAGAVDAAVAAGLEAFGRIDVLAANAGICTFHPIDGMPAEVWQEMIDINLTGVFNAVRAVVGHMIERGSGRIVATSSMAGRAGWENLSHYAAAKWGLIGFVKSVAAELAPHGITANVVCPSSVNTMMMHNDASYRLFRPDLEHPTKDDALPAFASVNVIPVPYVEPDDVSDSVLFLASDEARYVTGATLSPSAGVNARNI